MSDDHHSTSKPINQKVAADRSEEFVVFHIGVRINAFWKLHRWVPIVLIAPRMVRELISDPGSGLLESRTVVGPGIRNIGENLSDATSFTISAEAEVVEEADTGMNETA